MAQAPTNSLLNFIRDAIEADIAEIALGTGTTSPTTSDTALETETYREAVDSSEDGGVGEITHKARLTTAEGNGNDFTEAGAFEAGGSMRSRVTFSAVEKNSAFELEVRHKHTAQPG